MTTTTPDLTTYRAVHTALREAASRMAAASVDLRRSDWRRIDAFARYWAGYAGETLAHHTVEDDIMFPVLVERCPVAADLIARTDADHHHLDELLTAIEGAVAHMVRGEGPGALPDLLGRLAVHMEEHLAFEDADILPLFERHFTGEEFAELEVQAQRSLGLGKQAAFTIPFVLRWMDGETLARVRGEAPFALRALHRLTRRRHEKLTRVALGPLASASVSAGVDAVRAPAAPAAA
jgi:hemerythrin-like domain-containing protein